MSMLENGACLACRTWWMGSTARVGPATRDPSVRQRSMSAPVSRVATAPPVRTSSTHTSASARTDSPEQTARWDLVRTFFYTFLFYTNKTRIVQCPTRCAKAQNKSN